MASQQKSNIYFFKSERTVFTECVKPAVIVVQDDKIKDILNGISDDEMRHLSEMYPDAIIQDCGSSVLMPGVIDSHVHINEPGRTEWEGFYSATKAAAAGGVTTIADMPLNSIPPTTTLNNLKVKAKSAHEKVFVDVAFWGGVIPGNEKDLRPLVDAGVVGFKCFLCPSGVDEFPNVNAAEVQNALSQLKSTNSVLAFHAEFEQNERHVSKDNPSFYKTFLDSRPANMETNAIDMIIEWCKTHNVRCHIVHLSAAEALSSIADAKKSGAPLTVETCYHYLTLAAEEVADGATEFKCCPPIRNKANQDELWRGIKDGTLDMIVSDHSPCTPELKTRGNFLTAWGGISSLQFGLPLLWTAAREKGMNLIEISKLLSKRPAELCGLENRKGSLTKGYDADFVIWSPEETVKIESSRIFHKNKLTPYENRTLFGKVIATVLRGRYIYKDGQFSPSPMGALLLKENIY